MCEGCGSEKCLLRLAAREKLHVQVTVPEKIRSVTSEGYETQVINLFYNLEVTIIFLVERLPWYFSSVLNS